MVTTKAALASYVRVEEVMTPRVLTISSEFTVLEAAEVLNRAQVAGAPVLHNGNVVGVVSKSDLVGLRDPEKRTVREVMTRAVYAVRPDDPAIVAVKLLVDEGLHRLLVLGHDGEAVGIVSPLDICRALLQGKRLTLGTAEPMDVKYVSLAEMSRESEPAVRSEPH